MNPLLLQHSSEECQSQSTCNDSADEVKHLAFGGDLFRSESVSNREGHENGEVEEFVKADDIDSSSSEDSGQANSSEAWKKWKGLIGINWLRTYAQFVKERHRVRPLLENTSDEERMSSGDIGEWPLERQGEY